MKPRIYVSLLIVFDLDGEFKFIKTKHYSYLLQKYVLGCVLFVNIISFYSSNQGSFHLSRTFLASVKQVV